MSKGWKFIFLILFLLFSFFPVHLFAREITEVPFKSQVPPGNWFNTLNCGQTSALMIFSFFENTNPDTESIKKFDDWMFNKYGDPINNYSGSVTTIYKLTDLAKEYKGYNNTYYGSGSDIFWLKNKLKDNQPIIIATHINMDLGKRGHFMVALAVEGDYIIVHDPGRSEAVGKFRKFPLEQFLSSWKEQNNSYVVITKDVIKEKKSESETKESPTLWEKIKSFFKNNDNNIVQSEGEQIIGALNNTDEVVVEELPPVEEEIEQTGTYGLKFQDTPQQISVQSGETTQLVVKVKNTGTASWQGKNISANVTGGITSNAIYYHSSWLTKLRPSILQESEVQPGQMGTFSFFLNTPKEPGDYEFSLQAVRIDDNFSYITGGFWTLKLNIFEEKKDIEEIIEEVKEDKPVKKIEENTKQVVEDVIDKVKEVVKDIKETVKKIYYGGAGGGGGSPAPLEPISTPEADLVEVVQPEITITTLGSIVSTVTTTIAGTKNEATTAVYANTTTTMTYPSSTAWQAEVALGEGDNIFEFYGVNSNGDATATSSLTITLDTTAPDLPIVTIAQSEFATPTLDISWSSNDSGIGVRDYDLEYSAGGEWLTLATSTTSTSYNFIGKHLQTYSFRVRAYDNFANFSDWVISDELLTDWPKTVVINEIAWAGTSKSKANDEWFELYNNTAEAIDLSSWKVLVSGEELGFKEINNAVIPAHGYLLWERTNDTSIINVTADIIYTGGLNNDGELIQLINDSDEIIDEVDCSTGWLAGDNEKYRTMKRINSDQPGSLANNWASSLGVAANGRPQGGGIIYGSPGYQNIGYWLLKTPTFYYADQFVNNTWTLTLENSPYVIDYMTEIPAGYTLQVEPGVVLIGKDKTSYFSISGELILNGTADKPVVITSALDNNYVAQNLTTLAGETAQAGDWSRLEVQPNGKLTADHAKLYYGGRDFFQKGGFVFGDKYIAQVVRNLGGEVSLDNVEFLYNYTQDKESDYDTLVWTETPLGYNATTTISNSVLSGGNRATYFYGTDNGQSIFGSLSNSTLENFTNVESLAKAKYTYPEISHNTFVNNVSDYIDFGSWTLNQDITLTAGINYLFSSINIPEGFTLTLDPGVSLKMREYGSITINGYLEALGTPEQRIAINPYSGYWGSLIFSNSSSTLQNVDLSSGNRSSGRDGGMIEASNSVLNLSGVNMTNSRRPHNMLYLDNSEVVIKDSIISWTDEYISSLNISGIYFKGGDLHLDNVNFNRMDRGIEIHELGVITMENMGLGHFQNISDLNWWPVNAWTF